MITSLLIVLELSLPLSISPRILPPSILELIIPRGKRPNRLANKISRTFRKPSPPITKPPLIPTPLPRPRPALIPAPRPRPSSALIPDPLPRPRPAWIPAPRPRPSSALIPAPLPTSRPALIPPSPPTPVPSEAASRKAKS
ncbi:hypothetical protein MS3_00005478 [Schistosoma haematobium]|uniref:Uncharacterized protein n=1 Tax=Schistosoma haematobium TaxID=6185 RepID=A0A922LKF0_SCHHA|nr:hypothetical protein MS3_00005478 [Schistosoma haematobium]KAH9587913.1 hypothetical protein MS3_00005478 [Schistosoma haematobium]